jgi:hypothetical protein
MIIKSIQGETKKIFAVKQFIFLTFLLLILSVAVHAQTVVAQTETGSKTIAESKETRADSETDARVKQLESQVQAMQAQIDALKNSINQTQKQQTIASAPTENKTIEPAINAKTNESAKTEIKQTATTQTKQLGVDIGSARLTPYGTIYFNAFGNSGGTNNADDPLFATPTGTGNVSSSVRQTRLGLRLEGAKVGKARLGAVLEADFFGGFPSVGIGENFGVMRIRLANARLDWEKTSVTVGQDWMLFAPVNPTSLAAAAIPQMAAAGNNWARLPQIKVERKFGAHFTLAGAVAAPQTGDSATNAAFFLQPTSGAASRVPFLQTRVAFASKNWLDSKKIGSIGLSGHYGRSRIYTGGAANIKNNVDSFGVALDWNFPLHARLNLSGEAFVGRDLGGFQAGIFQNYNPDFAYRDGTRLISGGVRGIGTRGGWTQIGFTPEGFKDRLTVYGSIGVDDPRDEDLVSLSRRDFRTRNLAYAFDLIYRFTPQFQIGAEFRRFQTDYVTSSRQNANHVNLAAAYSF